jgi:hypothetical protein
MYNRAFWRALHSLTHPISIAAIITLFLNDHWLRFHYPSWLTGKLGDFTWLLFAPFIAATVVAWIVPTRFKQQETIVAGLAFCLIGLWFALAKTIPTIHDMTSQAWEAIIGWEGTLRIDPTDLVTLPALLLGWYIWLRVKPQPDSLRPMVPVALALGIVATLASNEPFYYYTDYGIRSVCEQNGRLFTTVPAGGEYIFVNEEQDYELTSYTLVFTSDDGGLTWKEERLRNETNIVPTCPEADQPLFNPNNSNEVYRWQPGEKIEISTDGGQTWTLERDLYELRQDVRTEHNHRQFTGYSSGRFFEPGPLGGIIHTETGNMVLAMGWDGVLVHLPDGTWRWVAVGKYGLADLTNFHQAQSILFFEFWQAGALGFLVVTTCAAYLDWKDRIRQGLLTIGWGGWFALNIIFLPPYHLNDDFSIYFIGLAMLILIAIPLSINAVWTLTTKFRRDALKISAVALMCALLYLLPFIPWTQGTIPRYTTALVFALLLAISAVASSWFYLRRVLPPLKTAPEQTEDTIDSL